MGVDVRIFVACTGDPPELNLDGTWEAADGFAPPGATHELDCFDRFYGIGYERGDWPMICGALLRLLSDEGVTKVWYCGDSGPYETESELTFETLVEISRHYVEHGHLPYRGKKH